MNHLSILKLANEYENLNSKDFKKSIEVNIVTNFTDNYLKKSLVGLCLQNKIYPNVHTVAYKQYHFELKQQSQKLWRTDAQITFFFFDTNVYSPNEFKNENHFHEFIDDLKIFAEKTKGVVVVSTFPSPTQSVFETLHAEDALVQSVNLYNNELEKIIREFKNIYLLDINRLIRRFGETHSRDMRHLYAYDLPFTHEFLMSVATEWLSYIKTIQGGSKKCIVLDLDNTLWGGIVGEVGPLGITLGHTYPGNTYQAFQKTLLSYYNRGIILAINSRNNEADVMEVFEKNKEMILTPKHFGAMAINWNDKATNIKAIAEDLNIGTDSMVFIDDDPFNRDLVRKELPEVLVPDFTNPDDLTSILLSLNAFPTLKITDEDRERNRMYADEKERKQILTQTGNIDDYIKKLNIRVTAELNNIDLIPRLAQLTQKTNQFNLTTRRYSEEDLREIIKNGGLIYSGDVTDSFGPYGITIMLIIKIEKNVTLIDNFLMSCRIMGRGIELAFISKILYNLKTKGVKKINGDYFPTQKNPPVKDVLPNIGFSLISEKDGNQHFELDLDSYMHDYPNIYVDIITR